MSIILKRPREIELMRRTGGIVVRIIAAMRRAAVAGTTAAELDRIAEIELRQAGATAPCKNFPTHVPGEGYPAYTCISINEEVVHGVPGPRILRYGDIVTLDLLASLDGYCASRVITIPVGQVSQAWQRLIDVTDAALALAIHNIQPGKKWSEVARLMQQHIESNGFSVMREFVGHGIGRTMIEDPKVCNFVSSETVRSDFVLRPGMTLTIEPMVLMGRREVELLADGWTVVAADGLPAAHVRHTVAITELGVDMLTDDLGAAR